MKWRQLKHYCDGPSQYGLNLGSEEYVDQGARLLRTTDIRDDGTLRPDAEGVFVHADVVDARHRLRPSDILFCRSGSLGKCLRVPETSASLTFAGYLVRFRPLPSTDARYLEYCASSGFFQAGIEADSITSTISNFNAERYGNLLLPDRETSEQCAIADFLDTETARIDALIIKKRRLIELLAERRAGEISRVLWFSPHRPIRLKYLCGKPTSGNRDHSAFTPDDSGVPCLRGLNVRAGRIEVTDLLRISSDNHRRLSQTQLRPGDLVIVRSGNAGTATTVPWDFGEANCVDLVLVRRSKMLVPRFLEYVVNSREAQEQVKSKSAGALLTHFNAVEAGDLTIPWVELGMQARVVELLDETIGRIDATAGDIATQINLLQEHRHALITAAVTGEVTVPGVAA